VAGKACRLLPAHLTYQLARCRRVNLACGELGFEHKWCWFSLKRYGLHAPDVMPSIDVTIEIQRDGATATKDDAASRQNQLPTITNNEKLENIFSLPNAGVHLHE